MNYVISIIAPTAEEKLVGICAELEIPLSVVLRGRGTAVQSMLELLGIESCERRIFMSLADGEKSRRYIAEQKKEENPETTEDYVKIADNYEIKPTTNISDA